MSLTAVRVDPPIDRSRKFLFQLSERTTNSRVKGGFDHVVLTISLDDKEMMVFPSDSKGNVLSYWGFGFSYSVEADKDHAEQDLHLSDCLREHERNKGIFPGDED